MADRFPKDFLWGASSSAFQIEGGWDGGGKGMTVTDHNSFKRSRKQVDSKVTSDFYNHWKEDIALMEELGMEIYRFSLSWARIIPDGDDEVNQQGITFCNDMINCLLEHGTQPFMTLYHFDLLYALMKEYSGWEGRRYVYAFERYTKVYFGQYGDRIRYWQVINEQNLMVRMGERININETGPLKAGRIHVQMDYHVFLAHALTSKACHELVKGGKVGPTASSTCTYPLTNKPEDMWTARMNDYIKTVYCLDMYYYRRYPGYYMRYLDKRRIIPVMIEGDERILRHGRVDYVALDYYRTLYASCLPVDGFHPAGMRAYCGNKVSSDRYGYYRDEKNENLAASEYGTQINPMRLRIVLNDYYSRYHVPLIITGNGLDMGDELTVDNQVYDPYRIDYIKGRLKACSLATQNGMDLMGYSPWSFIDLLSSHQGFKKGYGFVYVNREDMDLKDLARIKEGSLY